MWLVADAIIKSYGPNSKEFSEYSTELLSKKEGQLMKKNLENGEGSRWGIATAKNRRYNIKEMINLFENAKEPYDKLIKEKENSIMLDGVVDFANYVQSLREKAEGNPIYHYYK